ncbi:21764_t:CDS:2 [Dentiscutata erythropus]|uniref:21764_t:CDS:1 n=1 Tax=Dentiscutata erythropus TaxID=1348616 RepID=A0A9N8W634_9GLOM|nr:21764_t:CDS:2 [Dentiscutata erythropus]
MQAKLILDVELIELGISAVPSELIPKGLWIVYEGNSSDSASNEACKISQARNMGLLPNLRDQVVLLLVLWEDENDKNIMINVEKLKNELQNEGIVSCWVKICDDKYEE